MRTEWPAVAATSAIPLPIVPAPITATETSRGSGATCSFMMPSDYSLDLDAGRLDDAFPLLSLAAEESGDSLRRPPFGHGAEFQDLVAQLRLFQSGVCLGVDPVDD